MASAGAVIPGFDRRKLALVAALAIALRLFAWWLASGRTSLGDPYNYLVLAQNMLSGRGFVIDEPLILPNLRAYYPPLYPAMLAVVGLVFPLGQQTLFVLNLLTDVATAGMLILLARRLGQETPGRWAAALYLLWPGNLFLVALAQKEGLVNLLMLAGLYALVRAAAGEGRRWTALAGLAVGLLTLAQPGLAPLFALFFFAMRPLFSDWKRWWSVALSAAGVAALTMSPWWLRNALIFGHFVPLTTSGGITFWQAVVMRGHWVPPPLHLRLGGELEFGRGMAAEARRLIAADPAGYIANRTAHVAAAFFMNTGGIGKLIPMQPLAHGPLLWAMLRPLYLLSRVLLFSTLACAVLLRRTIVARLVWAGFAQILLFGFWFEFSERHMHFMVPLMLLLAAMGARDLARDRHERMAAGNQAAA